MCISVSCVCAVELKKARDDVVKVPLLARLVARLEMIKEQKILCHPLWDITVNQTASLIPLRSKMICSRFEVQTSTNTHTHTHTLALTHAPLVIIQQ